MGDMIRRVKKRRVMRRYRGGKYAARRFLLTLILLAFIAGGIYLLMRLSEGDEGEIAAQQPQEVVTETELQPTPIPELSDMLTVQKMDTAKLNAFGIVTGKMINREIVDSFVRPDSIRFKKGEEYTDVKGIITFAGNNYRNSFTYGTQIIAQKRLARTWEVPTGSLTSEQNGTWTGTGWTGQSLIIQWDDDVRSMLGVYDQFKNKAGFTEVIYPAMDGYIYFLELGTGAATRDPLYLGVVTKGTASIDPRGYPLLYTGQGIPGTQDGVFGSWFRIISLIDNKVIWSFGGQDPFSYREWQAYDSSPLIDAETDTLITGGENGIFYTVKLNTTFNRAAGTVSVNPGDLEKYRYTASGYGEGDTQKWWGIENSIAIFRNYAFFTDNGGALQCVDLNTMELQYVVDVLDDSDTSIVIEEDPDNGTFYLYTANEVDKQNVTDGMGKSVHRKIDGLTGEILWQAEWDASVGNTSSNGGTLTTPHVGHGSIENVVIYNSTLVSVTVNGETQYGGRIVAYDKETGAELWRYEQAAGYWSSPVVIYDENETAYLIQCDRSGIMRLQDPLTGKALYELDMGSRIESTPAVFNNVLVVGTRGQYGSGESQKIIGVVIN